MQERSNPLDSTSATVVRSLAEISIQRQPGGERFREPFVDPCRESRCQRQAQHHARLFPRLDQLKLDTTASILSVRDLLHQIIGKIHCLKFYETLKLQYLTQTSERVVARMDVYIG